MQNYTRSKSGVRGSNSSSGAPGSSNDLVHLGAAVLGWSGRGNDTGNSRHKSCYRVVVPIVELRAPSAAPGCYPLLQPPSSARLQHPPCSARLTCLRLLDLRKWDAQSLNRNGFDCSSDRARGFLHLRAFGLSPGNRSLRHFSSRSLGQFACLGRAVVPFLFWTFDYRFCV